MRVTTESGTLYEFTKDGSKFRRLRKRNEVDPEAVERSVLRQDGEWLKLFQPANPVVGVPMTLLVEPLADDGFVTVRMTTVVIGVEE